MLTLLAEGCWRFIFFLAWHPGLHEIKTGRFLSCFVVGFVFKVARSLLLCLECS